MTKKREKHLPQYPIYCKNCGAKLKWVALPGLSEVNYDTYTGYRISSRTQRLECPNVNMFVGILFFSSHRHPQEHYRDGSDDITKTISFTHDKEVRIQ